MQNDSCIATLFIFLLQPTIHPQLSPKPFPVSKCYPIPTALFVLCVQCRFINQQENSQGYHQTDFLGVFRVLWASSTIQVTGVLFGTHFTFLFNSYCEPNQSFQSNTSHSELPFPTEQSPMYNLHTCGTGHNQPVSRLHLHVMIKATPGLTSLLTCLSE